MSSLNQELYESYFEAYLDEGYSEEQASELAMNEIQNRE